MDKHNLIQHKNVQLLQQQSITWLDVLGPDKEVCKQLETEYRLHPIHLVESTQKIQHNKVEREEDYLFLVLHLPIYNAATDKITVGQLGVFLGKNFLITVRSGTSPAITDLFANYQSDTISADQAFKQGSSYLLYIVISNLLADISNMTDKVEDELDGIEDIVFDNNGSDAQRIGRIRQKIVKLKRVIGPKRLVLQDLADQINDFTGKDVSKYYSSNTKTVNNLWEVIEEAKETVEIYKDADFTTSTEQTNKILAVLTIIFTLTIPVTVIGTLYGMNVPLPGGIEAGPWTWFGVYTSFGILLAASVLVAVGMYVYFRRKKWF